MVGKKLAHYKIVSKIGEGGMGEVYEAVDTRLNRPVAIKVLPSSFSHETDRLGRFRREAKALASLNHPNIATIHGVEEVDGIHFLVLELVGGKTLGEMLSSGPIEVPDALRIAQQISQALEATHEKGIIHRDLKPANIMITPQGHVKVLDFGLAKINTHSVESTDPAGEATISMVRTEDGLLLGTPTYMSPEQARGQSVDKRTDIWAFGCVLYEALGGRAPFQRGTLSDTIAAILGSEPVWTDLPESVPEAIQLLLRRCLQRDVNRRLRDIGDARIEISESLDGEVSPRARRTQPSEPEPLARFIVELSEAETLESTFHPALSFSRDGTYLVYASNAGLIVRSTDELVQAGRMRAEPGIPHFIISGATHLPNTGGASAPFCSPDGKWIGFFSGEKLRKIEIGNSSQVTLCDAPRAAGGTWGTDGVIVFGSEVSGLGRVSDQGGAPETITSLDSRQEEVGHLWPQFLPGGKLLFTIETAGGADEHQVAVQAENGKHRTLITGANNACFVPPNYIVYYQTGSLLATVYHAASSEVDGPAISIVDDVMQSLLGAGHFGLSEQGWLVYVPGGAQERMVLVDHHGNEHGFSDKRRPFVHPRLSPDGLKALVGIAGSDDDIWVYEFTRDTLTQLTFEAENHWPIWTADEKGVTFTRHAGDRPNLHSMPVDQSTAEKRLTTGDHIKIATSWSPDGRVLAFQQLHPTTGWDIWMLLDVGGRKPRPFLRTVFNEAGGTFSPDGRWLAFVSDESGQDEIYVQSFRSPGRRRKVSVDGGAEPVWSKSGRRLFFRKGESMLTVDISKRPPFASSTPRLIFEGSYSRSSVYVANYDVMEDGLWFLMIQGDDQGTTPMEFRLILDWAEKLKPRTSASKSP